MDDKLKGLYVDTELHRRIKQIAAERGTSIREIVEKLLIEEIQKDAGNNQDQQNVLGNVQRSKRRDSKGPE